MVTPMPGGRRRIDRLIDPAFLDDIASMSLQELRDRRQDAMQEEADLSYIRRMLQGRIEILEQHAGSAAGESDDILVARLTQALARNTISPGTSSRHLVAEPSRISERRRYVERLIADVGLSDPSQLTGEQAMEAIDRLREQERLVSSVRTQVHQIIDTLTVEVGRRYRAGEAS